MEINLCIPTLNRYDLLSECILSAVGGTVKPTRILIVDNGGRLPSAKIDNVEIFKFGENIGVAASWNFFLKNTNEYRIICNDDIKFRPDSIEKLIQAYDEDFIIYPDAVDTINLFSCFILPDKIINSVGYFDEFISPKYAYFEDNDYSHRLSIEGFGSKQAVGCNVSHFGSATLKQFTPGQESIHHKLFERARDNYKRKWGGLPGGERFKTPYNR